MRYVLMPQAVRNALPALVNHSVSLFKNSSLAMAIGVAELTHAVREVENQSFRTFETYIIATVAYLVCSLVIMAHGAFLSGASRWREARYAMIGDVITIVQRQLAAAARSASTRTARSAASRRR